ncbi:MAG: DUF5362 family protein [Myxococcota bacterium]
MSYSNSGGHTLSPDGREKAQSLQFWLKFFGVFNMLAGGFYCLSIVGILVGWIPILIGYLLYTSGDSMERFAANNDIMALEESISSMRLFWMASGILTIASMVIGLLSFVVVALIWGAAIVAAIGAGL